jgi:Short C-terminal domain
VLFLYRPRQTWMPYRSPRGYTDQGAYNRHLQERFDATRRVTTQGEPGSTHGALDPVTALKQLAELHASGALDDAEFAAAKAKVLDSDSASS